MQTTQMIKVLLADDHVIVREGTRELIQRESGMMVVGEASDGVEAVEMSMKVHPDVVVMDIAMPRLNGIEATKQIKQLLPTTAILILTAYESEQYILAILEAGAAGFLLKNVKGTQLLEAIRAVYAGESVLQPSTTRRVIDQLINKATKTEEVSAVNPLTDREIEVLKMAARGVSNKDIADQLYLSNRTIQTHLSNIFKKLSVGSRTEAILYGLKRGWFIMEDLP
ncbi:MAG: response regulator transcription factor [Dehalococcoides mccartyi]|jgi:Response regulator containing a CheY-like receiver domain and an HTH DNA-binding domain|uniref:LuxR family DNA-binding response regulator n=2 Tax=root TaxID=1 RepID=A0A0V8M416_9CHLR|nr:MULTISPECIES: response regulator transcription factor [Dehalococcoides]AQU03042.1 DNA-binding response regulator [Dehalococcoides mccartyi]AQU04359.1 DNA-binding response regulator [Dehalococcoides mccartyi]KSV18540.1 LuxR family transcriptional regulator [Dehalococcoides mccartyi]MCF7634914.1 DNA-binding response regulator, LuxR family [Dehalococcoides mccartyi]MDN4185762.1 response regulator transcription factor [Dehalococcoides mccartyi]